MKAHICTWSSEIRTY